MNRITFAALVFTLITFIALGQTHDPERTKASAMKIFREKLRGPSFLKGVLPDENLMRQEQTESTETIVSGDKTEVESEIHAAINPLDSTNMVASSNKSDLAGNCLNYLYYSKDFGTTWKRSSFRPGPLNAGYQDAGGGDPVFVYDKNGRVYYSWISVSYTGTGVEWDLYWAYSDDDGETWKRNTQSPVIATSSSIGFSVPDVIYDKEWLACDMSNGAHANTIYCAFYEANTISGNLMMGVRRKDANQNGFTQTTVPVSGGDFAFVQFSSIDVDSKGIVHVSFFGTKDDSHWGLYYSSSADGGNTFSTCVKISDMHLPGFSPDEPVANITGIDSSRFYPCPHVVADKSSSNTSGYLYAVWSANGIESDSARGLDVYMSRSTDGGATWSHAAVVNDNSANLSTDQFYPTIDIRNDGALSIFYYDRRDDASNKLTNIYGTFSFDGGRTFNPAVKVTNLPADFSVIGNRNQSFGIGEYIQVVSSPSFAIPFWSDGRTNNGDINLYAALVPMQKRTETPPLAISYISINVGPVPTADFINIDIKNIVDDKIDYRIFDVTGRLLLQQGTETISQGETIIKVDASNIPNGTYLLELNSAQSGKIVRKLLVTK